MIQFSMFKHFWWLKYLDTKLKIPQKKKKCGWKIFFTKKQINLFLDESTDKAGPDPSEDHKGEPTAVSNDGEAPHVQDHVVLNEDAEQNMESKQEGAPPEKQSEEVEPHEQDNVAMDESAQVTSAPLEEDNVTMSEVQSSSEENKTSETDAVSKNLIEQSTEPEKAPVQEDNSEPETKSEQSAEQAMASLEPTEVSVQDTEHREPTVKNLEHAEDSKPGSLYTKYFMHCLFFRV